MYFYHSLLLTHIFELLHQHSNQLGKQEHKDLLSSQRMLIDFLDKQLRKFWWNNHRIILLGIFQCIVLFLGQQIIHHCRPKYSFLLCYYRNSWEQLDILNYFIITAHTFSRYRFGECSKRTVIYAFLRLIIRKGSLGDWTCFITNLLLFTQRPVLSSP